MVNDSGEVNQCDVAANGNLTNCTLTGTNMNGATGIKLVTL
ncbi:hypothetical protein [Legionella sp. 16cNR16C]|nr:hypothetical protein [Legionella sp. 16cNR16C]